MKIQMHKQGGGTDVFQQVKKCELAVDGGVFIEYYSGNKQSFRLEPGVAVYGWTFEVTPVELYFAGGGRLGVAVGKYKLWFGDRVLVMTGVKWPHHERKDRKPELMWRTGKVVGLGLTAGVCGRVVVLLDDEKMELHYCDSYYFENDYIRPLSAENLDGLVTIS